MRSFEYYRNKFGGTISYTEISRQDLLRAEAIRPFLSREKYDRAVEGRPDKKPKVFKAGEKFFVFDGHHRLRVALDNNEPTVEVVQWEVDGKPPQNLLQEFTTHGKLANLKILTGWTPQQSRREVGARKRVRFLEELKEKGESIAKTYRELLFRKGKTKE